MPVYLHRDGITRRVARTIGRGIAVVAALAWAMVTWLRHTRTAQPVHA